MEEKVKSLWLEALRSGDYTQGHGVLAEVNEQGVVEYCCLGVLCDLAVKNDVIPELTAHPNDPVRVFGTKSDLSSHFLPDAVAHWAGLRGHDPRVNDRASDGSMMTVSLSSLNDSGKPFAQIADFIEAQL